MLYIPSQLHLHVVFIHSNIKSKERVKKCKYVIPKVSLSHYTHETIFKLKIEDRE
jgi:hypothetical protein